MIFKVPQDCSRKEGSAHEDGMSIASGMYRLRAQTKEHKFAPGCVRKSQQLKAKPGETFLDRSLKYREA